MSRIKAVVNVVVILLVQIHEIVAQARMSISPSEVVLTSSSPPLTTFTCGFDSGTSVQDIYNMQILRQRESDTSSEPTPLAELKGSTQTAEFVLNAPQDILNRANRSGEIANPLSNSQLVLTFSTADIECSDRGHYFCAVSYQDGNSVDQSDRKNQTLQLYALPVNGTLSARHNNADLPGGTLTNQPNVEVGETVEFTCSARVGSDNTTRIQWKITTEIGPLDTLNPYNPPLGSYDNGNPIYHPNDCTYSRDATMTYNVTSFDANRANNLAFQCHVSVRPPGQPNYDAVSQVFYINPVTSDTNDNAGQSGTATAGGSNTGAIVGGVIGGLVLIVLIVLLVYFLWYRRRDDRESYRTKEDRVGNNSNIVPNTITEDQYATVNKERKYTRPTGDNGASSPLQSSQPTCKELHYAELDLSTAHPPRAAPRKNKTPVEYAEKRGHENRGLDDRHTPRVDENWYDEDSRGRTNIGIDRDYDDEYDGDGAHYVNHMGMDPHNGSLGTGV